tara:strand:+ start:6941 stop:7954 length:1014 start_codon:yes stop_codon:yes gene_type:complete
MMAKTVRELIQLAGISAGIVDIFAEFSDGEISLMLNQLNNSVDEFYLEEYFPHTKTVNTVSNVVGSGITFGKSVAFAPGTSTIPLTGTITGLTAEISSVAIPSFDAPTIIEGVNTYVTTETGISTYNGTLTDPVGGGVITVVAGVATTWNSIVIPIGTILTYSDAILFQIVHTADIYDYADIISNRPNYVQSVALLDSDIYKPLTMLDIDTFDNTYRSQATFGTPIYYTVRNDFPIMTIETYPKSTGRSFIVTANINPDPYELNDIINLPSGYASCLEYTLAARAAIMDGFMDKVPALNKMAMDVKTKIKRMNTKPKRLGSALPRNRYNATTDSWGN